MINDEFEQKYELQYGWFDYVLWRVCDDLCNRSVCTQSKKREPL